MEIQVLEGLLEANDACAARVRERLAAARIASVNLISSPGSGKTSIIEQTIRRLGSTIPMAVIEGDVATTRDAERVGALGAPVVQLVTGGACHLDARLIEDGVAKLDLDGRRLLIIENVGNMVCPAEFEVGEDRKIAILSVTEGHDKPQKYPLLFREADLLLLNKIDLLPHVDFDRDSFYADVRAVNANLEVFEVSCTTGEGLDRWTHWLEHLVEAKEGATLDARRAHAHGTAGHTHPHPH
jgi:hydrogenase nickel incorporation protein HypB